MKYKYLSILLMVGMAGLNAIANPPLKVDNIRPVGRLTFFKSAAEFSYYLPTAFNTEFSCIPQGDKKARCALNIINDLSESESKGLEQLGPSTSLSDLSYNVVSFIDERIEAGASFTEFQGSKTLFTKTLRLGPAPYVMTSFVIPKERLEEYKKAYQTNGLGEYVVKVGMKASDTNFYLSVKNGKTLKDKLMVLEDKTILYWDLNKTVKNLLKDLKISSVGYEDPSVIIAETFRARYFEKVGIGQYKVRVESVKHISDDEEIYQDDTQEYPYECEVSTTIKENAIPQTKCGSQE